MWVGRELGQLSEQGRRDFFSVRPSLLEPYGNYAISWRFLCVSGCLRRLIFSVSQSSRYQANGDENWEGPELCGLATAVAKGELEKRIICAERRRFIVAADFIWRAD